MTTSSITPAATCISDAPAFSACFWGCSARGGTLPMHARTHTSSLARCLTSLQTRHFGQTSATTLQEAPKMWRGGVKAAGTARCKVRVLTAQVPWPPDTHACAASSTSCKQCGGQHEMCHWHSSTSHACITDPCRRAQNSHGATQTNWRRPSRRGQSVGLQSTQRAISN